MDFVGPAPASQVYLFDTIRDLSAYNAKNYEYTDREGHVQGVLVDITIKANQPCNASVITIPNSWKMRNAFTKFHFKRLEMFRRAGVTKKEMGRYAQTLRPYADYCHSDNGSLHYNTGTCLPWNIDGMCPGVPGETYNFTRRLMTMGDWNRSILVAADANPTLDIVTGKVESADQWTVHICDGHDTSSAPWESVGMIQAYNEDRMEVVTPDVADSETIVGHNPLALLSSQSVTGGDVAELAEDQEQIEPPYDLTDGGDSIRKVHTGNIRVMPHFDGAKTNNSIAVLHNVFLPAGFCFLDFEQSNSQLGADVQVEFDVKGVYDCADWTE